MFNKTLIIGCGLIGSSILRSILSKKLSKKIYVHEKLSKNIKILRRINNKIVFIKNLSAEISNFDFIIIATPMSQYKRIFSKLNKFLKINSIVTEIGSTKNNVFKMKRNFNLILSHPIAGSEVSGPKFGRKDLFVNKWCVIIKSKDIKNLNKVKKFWIKLGSKVVLMDSNEHDRVFAITSHLPHLIAYNLIKTAQDIEKKDKKNIIKYSAGGLRDFSRTAASNEIMWRDIFFNNKINLIKAIELYIKNLKVFKKNIEHLNNKELQKILINSKKVRKQIIELKQDVSSPDFGRKI